MHKNYSLRFILLFCAAIAFMSRLEAQTSIGGVINSYASVSSIAGTNLTVSTATGFNTGDKILIVQMKGTTIATANTGVYGDISNYNSCGEYEFATITNISGTTITVSTALTNTYSTSGKVQIVSVPFYCSVSVDTMLTCQPWDGSTGGVLVFESGGIVTLNENIDVSGKGFRGQIACGTGDFACGNANWYVTVNNCKGGWKGEGIAEYVSTGQSGGRAKLANGGGGTNPNNSGGGGGGNYGTGGLGGYGDNTCATPEYQGIGGLALNYSLGKIFLGGAGGSGHGDDGGIMFGGTNGAGIVMISANTLNPNGFSIIADGIDQTGITENEGAGGGGAGGTICLDVNSITGPLNITAHGGDGGSVSNDLVLADCTGPGGGGGGGVLWVSSTALNPNITFTANGGAPGLILTTGGSCDSSSYNATTGNNGGVIFNYPPHIIPPPLTVANLGPDLVACPATPNVLSPGSGFSTFLWQDGSTDSVFTAIGTGTFSVIASDTLGCLSEDSILITAAPAFSFTIGSGDTTICPSQVVIINPGQGYSAYLWQDGSTSSTYAASDTGNYFVTVVDSFGCVGSSDFDVFFIPPFTYTIGVGDTIICPDQPVNIDAGNGFSQYLWNTGATTQLLLTTDTGLYQVTVTDSLGCSGSADYAVYYFAGSFVFLGNDTALCEGDSLILDAGIFPQYTWNDGSTNAELSVTQPGVYYVTIFDFNNCIISDTLRVDSFYTDPPDELVGDTIICGTQVLTIEAPQGYAGYLWSTGSTLNYTEVAEPGIYSITITNNKTCQTTDDFAVVTECPTGIFVPNAFTPNGDGKNDVFIPFGYNLTSFFMVIYNRWGREVFQTDNINTPWTGDCDGVECEMGTYIYRITWAGTLDGISNSGVETGNVTLIK